jgi:hypothetical protein
MTDKSRQGFDVTSLVAPFHSERGIQTEQWPLESRDYFKR